MARNDKFRSSFDPKKTKGVEFDQNQLDAFKKSSETLKSTFFISPSIGKSITREMMQDVILKIDTPKSFFDSRPSSDHGNDAGFNESRLKCHR